VQALHSVYHLAQLRREEGTPNIVLIGLPDAAALRRAEQKLIAAKIPHFVWEEPDYNFGLTSIATAPVRGDQRKALACSIPRKKMFSSGPERFSRAKARKAAR